MQKDLKVEKYHFQIYLLAIKFNTGCFDLTLVR